MKKSDHTKNYAFLMSSACVFLTKKEKGKTYVLLQKRQNTSFANGYWEAGAAGHVDNGESMLDSAIKEAKEELNVVIKKKDLKFISICHKRDTSNYKKSIEKNDNFYIGYFICNKWSGTPIVNEPNKCSEIKWFDIKKVPTKIIPDRKVALNNYLKKIYFFEFGWDKNWPSL